MTGGDDGPDAVGPIEPLGAPTDPLRPTGRLAPAQAVAESKAKMAAQARRILRGFAWVLAAAVLVAVLLFVVSAFLPKPDL